MICIVTVYKSNNYGSYLQAKALFSVLKKYDDCYFLDFNQRKINLIKELLVLLIKRRDIKEALRLWQCHCYWKRLPAKSLSQIKKRNDDKLTFVIGSDEVWNVERAEMNFPEFWGANLHGKLISYAPSINTASEVAIKESNYISHLNRFHSISVRDTYTLSVITKLAESPISKVLDPTLLWDVNYYCDVKLKSQPFDYIAVYTFFDDDIRDDIAAIVEFARKKNLTVVSVGQEKKWCDKSVLSRGFNPFLYFLEAKYVVTNTFHGTAFAINFKTQFVALPYKNRKVVELLEDFGLEGRNVSGTASSSIQQMLLTPIDYIKVEEKLEKSRIASMNFIESAMQELRRSNSQIRP